MRHLFIAFSFISSYFLVLKFTPNFEMILGGLPIALFCPTTGLAVSFLYAIPTRRWLPFLAAIACSHFYFESTRNPDLSVLLVALYVAEITIGTFIVRTFLRAKNFSGMRAAMTGVAVTFAITGVFTFLISVIMTNRWVDLGDFLSQWQVRWLADALGIIITAPVIISFRLIQSKFQFKTTLCLIRELAALCIALASVAYLALTTGVESIRPFANSPQIFLVLLLWAALRFGVLGGAMAMLLVTVSMTLSAVQNNGLFSMWPSEFDRTIALQMYLITSALITGMAAVVYREKRQMTQKITEQENTLLQVSRLSTIGELSAEIAHDLGQPLNAISNYTAASQIALGRVKSSSDPAIEKTNGWLEEIASQTERTGDVLKKWIAFSRPKPLSKKEIDIFEIAEETLQVMSPQFAKMQIKIHIEEPKKRQTAYADREQIQQVFVNALKNSIEALHETPLDRRWISISAEESTGQLEINIKDSGPGITGTNSKKLFQLYYTTKEPGLGIGLTVAQNILTAHGGQIQLANHDQGASFKFSLPTTPMSQKMP